MRQFLSALMKEGVISIVVLVLLCLLVWIGGEFLKTEDNDLFKERIAIIAVLIGLFLVLFLVQKVMAVRNAVRIEQQLKAQSGSQLQGADADKKAEIEALGAKFNESLEALKKTKGGKGALFTLPWYIIIGPPGSGKTTALQESGLNFPAAQGGAKVRGIGGTRNCDWWFTEDGILLDTAGRYTTVAEDQEEWFAFLEMIRNSRKDKPINGAIVAIAIDELFRSTQAEVDRMAKDVRNRLDELAARLQAVFPVYMMFTKCDLIQGFVEYFEDFNKDQRGQVWGFTFPYALPDKQYTDVFTEQVGRMSANIQARQLELLATERPPHKKQNIYLFPRQFALASEKMKEFLGALFHANAFQESAMLRGIYFTSGTQKGTPIDQILSRMGEAMGLGSTPEGSEERVEKKSYFIHNLFTKIIFHDKTLARSNSRVLRKRRAIRLAVQLSSLIGLVLMSWLLLQSFFGNRSIINEVEASGLPVRELPDSGQLSVEQLQVLDGLRRELVQLDDFRREGRPISLSYGMYKGDTMFESGGKLYFQRVRPLFIEPCGQRVEREVETLVGRLGPSSPAADYEKLLDLWRVYRMLGGVHKPQPALIGNVLKKEGRWAGNPADDSDEYESLAGEQLEFYASQLESTFAAQQGDPFGLHITIDTQLSDRAAEKLSGAFWIPSAYEAIIQHTSEKRKDIGLEDIVPTNSGYLELRTDKTSLRRLDAYTQEAWDADIKALIDQRSIDLEALYNEFGIKRSKDDIRAELYAAHKSSHVGIWNEFLRQVYTKPGLFADVKDTNEALKVLAGPQSPYRDLLRNTWVRRQLTLSVDNKVPGATEEQMKALEAAIEQIGKFSSAYDKFWTTLPRKGSRVMPHADNPEPLQELSSGFKNAKDEFEKLFPGPGQGVKSPECVALMRVIDAGFDALKSEGDAEIKKAWKEDVLDNWKSEFDGRYPFNPRSNKNVPMASFARMFNPKNGHIWAIDRRLRALEKLSFHDGRKLVALTAEYDNTIRLARDIKDAMFDADTDELVKAKFSVKLTPVGVIADCLLEIGTDADGNIQSLLKNENPDQIRDFVWAQYNTGRSKLGARVSGKYSDRKAPLPDKNLMEDEWGLLKIVRPAWSRSFEVDATGDVPRYRCLWEFKSPDGLLFFVQAQITPSKKINPFMDDLFTRFTPAENVNS